MSSTILGIPEEAAKKILSWLKQIPEIEKAILFGSRAKGTQREGSDIDIALLGKRITFSHRDTLLLSYDALYLPWKVDLVLYDQIEEPDLKSHIDRVGKIIFSRP